MLGSIFESGDEFSAALRGGVVGVFALGIGVVDNETKRRMWVVDCGVFEHLHVTVAITEAGDGAAPDELVDAGGFACFVVDEEVLHCFDQHGAVVAQFVDHAGVRSDDLLGWNTVNALAEDAHEIGASAGDEECFESVGAEVREQFEHGLVGQLIIRTVEARVLGRGEPRAYAVREFDGGHAGAGQLNDAEKSFVVVGEQRWEITFDRGLDNRVVLPGWFVRESAI